MQFLHSLFHYWANINCSYVVTIHLYSSNTTWWVVGWSLFTRSNIAECSRWHLNEDADLRPVLWLRCATCNSVQHFSLPSNILQAPFEGVPGTADDNEDIGCIFRENFQQGACSTKLQLKVIVWPSHVLSVKSQQFMSGGPSFCLGLLHPPPVDYFSMLIRLARTTFNP